MLMKLQYVMVQPIIRSCSRNGYHNGMQPYAVAVTAEPRRRLPMIEIMQTVYAITFE